MTVKLAHALGAHFTMLSHSPNDRDNALRLGACDFINTKDESAFKENAGHFDSSSTRRPRSTITDRDSLRLGF
jgi:uncharacterized zinc-type alcohol dehydrogenase-like protein